MKIIKYLLIIVIILFISGCVQDKIPAKASAEPIDEPIIEEQNKPEIVPKAEEKLNELPDQSQDLNIINFENKKFDIKNININEGEAITWKSQETFNHQIACYKGPNRIVISETFKGPNEYSYTFDEVGSFLCIDTIYGARLEIKVLNSASTLITGNVIGFSNNNSSPLGFIFLLGILALFISQGFKNKRTIRKKRPSKRQKSNKR